MRLVDTIRFRRGKLPHWEVAGGRYFVTIRLADSLPQTAVLRLQEIHASIAAIDARSEQFVALQRQYFLTTEKYLDAGAGSCVLRNSGIAENVAGELRNLKDWDVEVPHFAIMPNHCHALVVPTSRCTHSLEQIIKRVKGRTGRFVRESIGGTGPVWQREWFDRWMRDDNEWEKTVAYIHNNPVKAGIVTTWQQHPWTK